MTAPNETAPAPSEADRELAATIYKSCIKMVVGFTYFNERAAGLIAAHRIAAEKTAREATVKESLTVQKPPRPDLIEEYADKKVRIEYELDAQSREERADYIENTKFEIAELKAEIERKDGAMRIIQEEHISKLLDCAILKEAVKSWKSKFGNTDTPDPFQKVEGAK